MRNARSTAAFALMALAACGARSSVEEAAPSPPDKPPAAPSGDTRGLQAGAPWPMFGRCPTHIGRADVAGAAAAEVAWTFSAPDGGFFGPAVIAADGTLYLTNDNGTLYAIGAGGTQKWALPIGQLDHFSSPAIGAVGRSRVSVLARGGDAHERTFHRRRARLEMRARRDAMARAKFYSPSAIFGHLLWHGNFYR